MRDLSYNRVLTSDASFQLVRTNPKLTGNLKITIDGSGDMWLNAIKANAELSKDDYSRFPIDPEHSLASNVFRFFKEGTTPNEIIFSLSESIDLTKTSKDLKDQYDFSNYFSGVKYLPSNKYSEKFSYFAPLVLKKTLPKYFIIFKINDPLNKKIDLMRQDYESGQDRSSYLIELFRKATIIKTFDLSEESKPGKFIRQHMAAANFPNSPLSVSFGEDEYTTWNGILVNDGIMGSRGELLYKQYTRSSPLKTFEEMITNGFERNGVIVPDILNLEFIFDDSTSEKYDINRYLGIYVDTIEISKLDVDLQRAYDERSTWENEPRLRREYTEDEEISIDQTNLNGVIVPYKNIDFNMSEFDDIFTDSETLYFNYLTDRFGNLHLPKLDSPYSVDFSPTVSVTLGSVDEVVTATSIVEHGFSTGDLVKIDTIEASLAGEFIISVIDPNTFTYSVDSLSGTLGPVSALAASDIGVGKVRMSDTHLDLGHFFGPSEEIFLQDTAFVANRAGRSYTVISLSAGLGHGDTIKVYHPTGTRTDANGRYDMIQATVGFSQLDDPGDYYVFNDVDGTVGHDVFYLNGEGTSKEVAGALAKCLNGIRNKTFFAQAMDEHVFIICTVPGEFDNRHKISFESPTDTYSTVKIDQTDSSSFIGTLVNFKGGSKYEDSRLVMDRSHYQKIVDSLDSLLVRTTTGWSKVRAVSGYIDLVSEEAAADKGLRSSAISEYLDSIVLILEQNERPTIAYTQCMIRKKFRPAFGLLSVFPIKDLDLDFEASEYLNFPIIDLYQHYYVPEGVDLLEPDVMYSVSGGTIKITSTAIEYSTGESFYVLARTSYSVVTGDPVVYYDSDGQAGSSWTVPILDENSELKEFKGFSILKDPTLVIPQDQSLSYSLKKKYTNGLTETEYDFYKENESSNFAVKSRIIPYITKWGIKSGFDSRDNPYRLNAELVFGRNNFSPDHRDRTQDPDKFTHEWFYVESKFNYLNSAETSKQNGYYFDESLDIERLKTDPDYFLEYFTYTPAFGTNAFGEKIDIAPTQFRYSTLFKNRAGTYETFFKGFKVSFVEYSDPDVVGLDNRPIAKHSTSRFDGYRFSCILKPIQESIVDDTTPPLKFRVIEHKSFKFIVVVIEVYLGHIGQIGDYWKDFPASSDIIGITNDVASTDRVHITDPYSTLFGTDLPYESINGDYRIQFNDGVSNLSHAMLYALRHKKFNTGLDNFSNTKLSSKVKITTTGINPTTIEKLANHYTPNYPSLFSDDLPIPRDLTYVVGFNSMNNQSYFIDQADQTVIPATSRSKSPITRTTSDFLTYRLDQGCLLALSAPATTPPYLVPSLPILGQSFETIIKNYFAFFAIAGGQEYLEKLFEKVSFARFKDYVNRLDPVIEYETYEDQSGTVVSAESNIYLDIPDQSEITKREQVFATVDTDRPSQFSFESVIGYRYSVQSLVSPIDLHRYRGEYEPIFKNVLHCKSNFKFKLNPIYDLNLSNTKLNTAVSDFMTLRNFNHIKIADNKILELESDPSYLPVYPKIGETPIGTSDLFLLQSNWDWGFHRKYSNKFESLPVAGSIRVEEDESFIGKVVALRDTIELENFVITQVDPGASLDTVDIDQVEMVVRESQSSVDGLINVNQVLTRYLVEDGISEKFNDFLVESYEYLGNIETISDYVKEYIRLNILKLYSVSSVEFYSKRDATVSADPTLPSANSVGFVFLNDTQRFRLGYSQLKTVQINKADKLILGFSIQKPLDAGLQISPKVKISFI